MSAAKEVTGRSKRRRGYRQRLLAELREHVENAAPFALTFKPTGDLNARQIKELEAILEASFRNWAATWIFPWIDEIEAAWVGEKKGGSS
jgi:hypothetical protein